MLNPNGFILIAAYSGRMLAQAARNAGYKPLVVDVCGDIDTCRYAEDNLRVVSLDECHIIPAVESFIVRYPLAYVVYGSGFERYPDSLKAMATRLRVLGNGFDVIGELTNKQVLFATLKNLGIPYPQVDFYLPAEINSEWLFKPMHSYGGLGITRFNGTYHPAETVGYLQRYQKGTPHSVLFVANSNDYQIIGFNRQWSIALDSLDEFIFSGVINAADLAARQKQEVEVWVGKLVAKFSLIGLNSLDFIQEGDNCYFLEVNARPPASIQLYHADLFKRHVQSCFGELTGYQKIEIDITAYQIVYADKKIVIPPDFPWPEGVMDLPEVGSIINTGQPICSIIAHGNAQLAVLEQIQQTQKAITQQLNRFKSHGI